MKKGDIILVPFPFTDLSGSKLRPALVLAEEGDDVIAAFISTVLKDRFKSDYFVKMNEKNCLRKDSLVKLNKLATLSYDLIKGKIGELSSDDLKETDKKLMDLFKLKPEPTDETVSSFPEGDSPQQLAGEQPIEDRSPKEPSS
jgi:mRNA interferase MazF